MDSPLKLLVLYNSLELDTKELGCPEVKVYKPNNIDRELIQSIKGELIIDGIFQQDVSVISNIMAEASYNPNISTVIFSGKPPRLFSENEYNLILTDISDRLKEIIDNRDSYTLDNTLQVLLSFGPDDYILQTEDKTEDYEKSVSAFFNMTTEENKIVNLEDYLNEHTDPTVYNNYIELKKSIFKLVFSGQLATGQYVDNALMVEYEERLFKESSAYLDFVGIIPKRAGILSNITATGVDSFVVRPTVIVEF